MAGRFPSSLGKTMGTHQWARQAQPWPKPCETHRPPQSAASMEDHPEQGGTLGLSDPSGRGGLKGLQKGCLQRTVSHLWLTPSPV